PYAVARLAQGRAAHGGPARAPPRALREYRRTMRARAGAVRRRAAHRGAATTPSPAARHTLDCPGGDDPGGRPMRRVILVLLLTLLTAVLASGTAAAPAAAPRGAALPAAGVAPQPPSA